MASEEVKQKLQSSILRRQSYEQAKTQRETEQTSELNFQQEQPNTPPSPQHKALMASEEVKQKLQSSILRRQSYEQAKTQRETEQTSELNFQQEQPNTPPSPQHK
ncbi:histone deacetylase 4 isoform X1, partial [Tachysurus ichikawai]